jgi:hypothetical protein
MPYASPPLKNEASIQATFFPHRPLMSLHWSAGRIMTGPDVNPRSTGTNQPKNILQKDFLCAKVLSKAPEIPIDF